MNTYWIKFLNLNGIDTSIKYSTTTRKFYVSTSAEIKEGDFLTSFSEHEDTIEKAVESFNERIKGKLIVINAYGGNRLEFLIPDLDSL